MVLASAGKIIHEMRINVITLHPRIQLVMLATLTTVVRSLPKKDSDQEAASLLEVLPDMYGILQYNMRRCEEGELFTKVILSAVFCLKNHTKSEITILNLETTEVFLLLCSFYTSVLSVLKV